MELLGLKWDDVDWLKQTIKVERQLLRPGGEGIQFSTPKTKSGKRTLPVGGRTIEVLRSHYNNQQKVRIEAGDSWQEHSLIFTNQLGGPIDHRNLVRNFKKLLKNAGLPEIRFHDLRHTAASLMLKNGISVMVVSKSLGHARPSITLDIYGHLIPGMQVEAAEKIDELVMPIGLQAAELNCTQLHSNALKSE